MSPRLLAVLLEVQASGHEVNDVVRVDREGDVTNIAITWKGQSAMDRYIDDEDVLADTIMREYTTRVTTS